MAAIAYKSLADDARDLFHRGAYENALNLFAASLKSVERDIGIIACHYALGSSFQNVWEMYLKEYSDKKKLPEFTAEWERFSQEGL